MQHNASICLSLLGQLVQHCNGTPEGGGSTSIQAWIFFRHYFPYWLSCGHYSKSLLHSLLCSATSILIIWLVWSTKHCLDLCSVISIFNSLEWPRQNFSSLHQYNIKQTSNENKKKISVSASPTPVKYV